MEILQLSNKIPYPHSDGGVIAMLSLAIGLADWGHTVTNLSMSTLKHHYKVENIPSEFSDKIKFISVNVPAEITAIGALRNYLFSTKPYTATRFISPDYSQELIRLLKENQYDIIQLEGLYLAPYIALIKQYTKARIVMRAHNIEHEIWQRVGDNTKNKFKKIYLRNLNKRLKQFELSFFDDYDLLLPITQRDASKFKDLGFNKTIYTLPTGIDIQRYNPEPELCKYPSLFHLGSLDWEPNIEGLRWFLSEIWPQILKTEPLLQFFVAGRNASTDFIKYIQSFKNVIYDGEVEDANQYINSKSIMIVPLRSGSGMRIKILEGLALSKVIVSTQIGAEGITAKDGQEIVIADDVPAFVEKIISLVRDANLYNAIKQNAREYIMREFDNRKIVKNLIEKYQNIVNKK